jgi:hypothetical protein
MSVPTRLTQASERFKCANHSFCVVYDMKPMRLAWGAATEKLTVRIGFYLMR